MATQPHPIQRPSPNRESRRAVDGRVGVRFVIVHYTGMETAAAALERLCDPTARVSAHYLIEEDGTLHQLVDENARAWHAGLSFWGGISDINSASVGVELQNPGHALGYRPFPAAQIAAFVRLGRDLLTRHDLDAAAVLGHSDIAPGRKQDPGELFPWNELVAAGLGVWPATSTPKTPGAWVWNALSAIGYAVPAGAGADILDPATGAADVIAAFQRRYQPDRITGIVDSVTAGRIAGVAAAVAGFSISG
jgi:N-acetylmuramoyl-L-alanine amidase